MHFSSRLNDLLKKREMSAADLSRITGIPESAISQYRRGFFIPKQDRMELLANALHCSPAYLATGRKEEPPTTPPAPPIPGFDELTDENKKVVQDYIDFLLSKQ